MPGVKNYVQGGVTGASLGASAGPWGAAAGGALGLLGAGLGVFGGGDAEKALLKKQEELAAEAKKQQERNAQMRMQALGQSMLAFNPQNQMMAQMFGPEAAFSPQQMAQMSADPGARSRADFEAAQRQAMGGTADNPNMMGRTGAVMGGWTAADMRRMEENERRMAMVQQQTTPLGPGPAPLKLPKPQPGRRY